MSERPATTADGHRVVIGGQPPWWEQTDEQRRTRWQESISVPS
ncbi:hypothetical protein [Mycolicibacterium frederiksbergense]|nr:hypothetical protein [Mycolicibacterium frederiksbergense]MDO0976619.1 hypothetical protein [Mycolicibacterium frederiksbergense]